MVVEKILCDRCKKEVNGKGYSFSSELIEDYGFRLAVITAINETSGDHFCGKQCLMLTLNEMVDKISRQHTPAPRYESQPTLSRGDSHIPFPSREGIKGCVTSKGDRGVS